MPDAMEKDVNMDDVMRVLVATDNHLGYCEQDPVRGDDSFIAFEEILEYAVRENVDFILLGGDLFHDAVPSPNTLNKCMTLLRRYTFGDRPIPLEYLSTDGNTFHNSVNDTVNYEDPDMNISIPVFSIHGNHDDPSGFGRLSSLDLLSINGLINYFGRWKDLSQIEIKPVLLRKGATQLALYGLSHIHDSRLARLFDSHKVEIECPSPDSGDWFHLMVVHQNRNNRGPKNYLPEDVLPEFLNLVIWGHEHDCLITPEPNAKGFYVSQPGSSVPTSLSEGEAIKKHVGLLEIYKTKFQLTALPLQTVRPFVFESTDIASLADELRLDKGDVANKVRAMAQTRVDAMLERAIELQTDHAKQPKLPQIRLRLLYSDEEQMFNTIRFGQMYNDRVANPADMVVLKKLKKFSNVKRETAGVFEKQAMQSAFDTMGNETNARVEDMLEQYFENVKHTQPQTLPAKMMSEMCYQLVERRDITAVDNMLKSYKKLALDHLLEKLPADDDIDAQLTALRDRITIDEITKMSIGDNATTPATGRQKTTAPKPAAATSRARTKPTVSDTVDLSDDATPNVSTAARGGRGAGRARGGARGRGAAAAATAASGIAATTTTRGRASNTTARGTKHPLDVSINTTRTTRRQPTLLTAIGGGTQPSAAASKQQKKSKIVVVSSSDESD